MVGFEGTIANDTSRLTGTPLKLMSADRIRATGWQPSIGPRASAYLAFLDRREAA